MTPEKSQKLQRTAIDSKDKLINRIDSINDLGTLLLMAPIIGTAMDMTQGIWTELGYAYKAKEILERLKDRLCHFEAISSESKNMMELFQIQLSKAIIDAQIEEFHHLQQERMSKDASLN